MTADEEDETTDEPDTESVEDGNASTDGADDEELDGAGGGSAVGESTETGSAETAAGRGDEPLSDIRERVMAADGDADASAAREAEGEPGARFDEPADRTGPLGEVASGIDDRRQRKTKTDEELFESMDVGEVDSDALWEQVEEDETVDTDPGSREIREIDKHKYCKKCPHFSAPPEVHCTHEGTDILEQIDMDQFKVADCPIILEDERLEDVTTE